MTPRVPRSTALAAALLVGGLALTATAARLSMAQDSPDQAVSLKGVVQAERAQMLREEFKERQREVREAHEARAHHKQVHGKHAEQATNDDYVGGANSAKFTHPTTFTAPTNVKANDKTGDGVGAGQAEQHIAFLGQNGLCAWNDGQGFNVPPDVQGYGTTNDGGATWTDGGVPLKGGTITAWTSDPSVAVNEKSGAFFYNGLTSNSTTNNNGVGVARGHFTAGVWGWDAATVVASGPSSSQGFDKQWIAADSLTGNVYVTWTLFTTTGDAIWFSRSTDNGGTWSAPLQVSGSWENGLVSGSRPMVGPNGEVYVLYTAIGPVDADSIKVARSTDGGVTFGPSVVAMTDYDNYFTGSPGFNRPRAVTFAAGAVDRSTGPNRGRVYTTVQDCVDFYADNFFINSGKSEVEPNSGFLNSTPFTIGQTLRGTLTSTADQDWWNFAATQGTTYIFYVDSLKTTGFRYTMRLYCPNDTTVLSRLAFSGAQATNSAQGSHSLIVWTAPTTNTYYLRMVPVTTSSTNSNYRILTAVHVPNANDVARDTRDVMVASSADGVTGWSPRVRVNDDAALYDNWLPEVAVPCDGKAYLYWFDWRDAAASCFGGSNIYLSRSLDGGATWSANQVATTAPTPNWTQVASNIAPNQGDYNGIYGGDRLALAFADGRLGDADVFTASLLVHAPVGGCPGDQVVFANSSINGTASLSNQNVMFDNNYNYTISTSTNWPGFPASGTLTVLAGSSGNIPWSVSVPDTAADGEVVHVCITASQNGACVDQCCFNITVSNPATPTLLSLFDALQDSNGGVDLSWSAQSRSIAGWNVYRGASATTAVDRVNATRIPVSADGTYTLHDDASVSGMVYYRLAAVLGSGLEVDQGTVAVELSGSAPHAFAVALAGGNPFRGKTSVSLALPTPQKLSVEVYNVAGQRIATLFNGPAQAGNYTMPLSLAHSGVYLVSVKAGPYSKVLRVTSLQ
jgi:hypothetical protein